MLSLYFSKIIKNKKILKKLDKNIYFKIKYANHRIMIVDDNLDFNLLNSLFNIMNLNFLSFNLNNDDSLDELIIKYSDKRGNINKDFLFFKVDAKNIKKYGSIIKPDYILVNETSDVIDELEVSEIFSNATIILNNEYDFEGVKYSLTDKNSDYYISDIDYIKEKITINKTYDINIKNTSNNHLKEIIMLFSFIKTLNFDINAFNKLCIKNFSYENKKIFIDISRNNYNDAIKFISRYSDYKVIVIGWKLNYNDISWLYNVEFERLVNRNVQKFYCIGTNAFDIATRLKYSDINEKNIIVSSNIDVVLKEIKNYNLNLYVLADHEYINTIKEVKE